MKKDEANKKAKQQIVDAFHDICNLPRKINALNNPFTDWRFAQAYESVINHLAEYIIEQKTKGR